jgi:hypothetical protein
MPDYVYIRRGTDAERQAVVLYPGEPGWTLDTKRLYIGDGTTSGGIFVGGEGVGLSSLNSLIGIVTISGEGLIEVTVSGQNIIISGNDLQEFDELTDTPSSYTNYAKKVVMVKDTEDGLEFSDKIDIPSVLTSDHSYAGLVCSGVAGATFEFGNILYYSDDSKWWKTNADTESEIDRDIAMVVTLSGLADSDITLLQFGTARDDSWSWSVPSGLYVSTVSGEMTHTQPATSGYFVRKVGWARGANIVSFKPDSTVLKRGITGITHIDGIAIE